MNRRAMYSQGAGVLWVEDDRLLFVVDGAHPACVELLQAASELRPMRALASVMAAAGFECPDFVFLDGADTVSGIAFGDSTVSVGAVTIDPAAAEPWAQFAAEAADIIAMGEEAEGALWLERGVVRAAGFTWGSTSGGGHSFVPQAAVAPAPTLAHSADSALQSERDAAEGGAWAEAASAAPLETPSDEGVASSRQDIFDPDGGVVEAPVDRSPDTTTDVPELMAEPSPEAAAESNVPPLLSDGEAHTPADVDERDLVPESAASSLAQALDAHHDNTLDAIRFAEIRDEVTDGPTFVQDLIEDTGVIAEEPIAAEASEPDAGQDRGVAEESESEDLEPDGLEPDVTIDLEPGVVLLGDEDDTDAATEALLCLACGHANPPSAARCRGCSNLMGETNSERRRVAQPMIGEIVFDNGVVEQVDADLVIGRNPLKSPLEARQRAVVHGEGDRTISRRHLELRRDGWDLIVVNLKQGEGTTVEGTLGGFDELAFEVPRRLDPGDTIRFGGSWLRFEEA